MLSCFLATCLLAANPQVQVQTFSGESFQGQLAELTADKVVVETADGKKSLSMDDLLQISCLSQPVATLVDAVEVTLVDGSVVLCKDYQVADGKASLIPFSGEAIKLPNADVARVRFQPLNEMLEPQWERILERKLASDVLVVRRDQSIDHIEGVFGNVAERIDFNPGDGVIAVKREKAFAMLYFLPGGRTFPASRCLVTDTTGAKWKAAELLLADGGLQVKTSAGFSFTLPTDKISRLDFSQGKVQFLANLTPLSLKATPFLGYMPEMQKDRALDGGPLSLEGKTYLRGIAMHSRTQVVYRLNGEFRRFQTVLGIDDSVGSNGHVDVTIKGDDRVLFSGILTGRDNPRARPLDLDITGLRRLEIFVDYGRNRDEADHVDFCEARIIK